MKMIIEPVSLNDLWKDRQADLEAELLSTGSKQEDLWGANIYVTEGIDNRLEFTSFINIRPGQGNRSMEVVDNEVRNQMTLIVNRLLV